MKCLHCKTVYPVITFRLTAFVLKSFAQAAESTYIDPEVIRKAAYFLLRRQSSSGEFKEYGTVYSKALQVLSYRII